MRDLNDLQFFAAVIAHGSFSAAARQLGVPKSRISRRVALLEEELGVRLIERSTRHLSVTEVGQHVYDRARAALEEVGAIEDAALRSRSEPRGLVRVSCPLGLTRSISELLPAFLLKNPLLRVQIIVTNRRVDLVEESVDVSIRVRERLDTDVDLLVKKIGLSRRILVAAPQLLASLGTPSTPGELSNYPLLNQQEAPGPSVWPLTNESGETATVSALPRLAAGDFGVLVSAARKAVGIALVPYSECKKDLSEGSLIRILSDWAIADGTVHLVFTSRRGMLPGIRAVIDFLADTLRLDIE